VISGRQGAAEKKANEYASNLGNISSETLSRKLAVRRSGVTREIVFRVVIGPALPTEELKG